MEFQLVHHKPLKMMKKIRNAIRKMEILLMEILPMEEILLRMQMETIIITKHATKIKILIKKT